MSLLGRLFSRGGMDHYRRGILHFNQSEYQEAVREFELCLASLGDRNDPYYNLGRFYAAEAHAKLGLALQGQGRGETARAQFESALAQGYRYPDLHFFVARIQLDENTPAEAESHCRQALEINPGYLEARALLGVALSRQDRFEEARAVWRPLAASEFRLPPRLDLESPAPIDSSIPREVEEEIRRRQESHEHVRRALAAYDHGDRAQACEELKAAVAQKPGYADLRCKLGIVYAEMGELERAERELNAALQINPNYVEARLQAGLLALRRGRPAPAWTHLEMASRRQPEYPDAALFLALAELRAGRTVEAEQRLQQLLQVRPGFHRARRLLALVHLCAGKGEEATLEMQQALEGDAGLRGAPCELALLRQERRELPADPEIWESILAEEPEAAEAHYALALARLQRDEREAAAASLRKACELAPGFVRANDLLIDLEMRAGRPAAAESRLRDLLAGGESADLCHRLGRALQAQGRIEEAIVSYRRALGSDPRLVEARLALGLALLGQGATEAAGEELRAVLRQDPTQLRARALVDPRLVDEL